MSSAHCFCGAPSMLSSESGGLWVRVGERRSPLNLAVAGALLGLAGTGWPLAGCWLGSDCPHWPGAVAAHHPPPTTHHSHSPLAMIHHHHHALSSVSSCTPPARISSGTLWIACLLLLARSLRRKFYDRVTPPNHSTAPLLAARLATKQTSTVWSSSPRASWRTQRGSTPCPGRPQSLRALEP